MARTIVLDFDDVCVNFGGAYLHWHNYTYGTELEYEDFDTFDLEVLHQISKEEKNRRVLQFWQSAAHRQIKPIIGAVEAVARLATNGWTIHLASGRSELIRTETDYLINKHFHRVFDSVHLLGTFHDAKPKSKAEVCRELKADVFVDDAMRYAKEVAESGVLTYMPDRPWNKKDHHPQVHRIIGLADLVFELEL